MARLQSGPGVHTRGNTSAAVAPRKPKKIEPPPVILADGTVINAGGKLSKALTGEDDVIRTAGSMPRSIFDEAMEKGEVAPPPRMGKAIFGEQKVPERLRQKATEKPVVSAPRQQPKKAAPFEVKPSAKLAEKVSPKQPPVIAMPAKRPTVAATSIEELMQSASPRVYTSGIPEGFVRVELPSRGVPYARLGFTDVYVRPLEVPDLVALIPATKKKTEGEVLTVMLDALSRAIAQDVRELTEPDFRFLMYWWKVSSFLKSPMTISWTSRYGNLNETKVTSMSQFEIKSLALSPADYQGWLDKGIRIPTMRDIEAIENSLFKDDVGSEWLSARAQYVHLTTEEEAEYVDDSGNPLDWFPSRFKKLNAAPMSYLEDISTFAEQITHGVIETLTVQDQKFDPEKASEHLNNVVNGLEHLIAEAEGAQVPIEQILTWQEQMEAARVERDAVDAWVTIQKTMSQVDESMPSEDVAALSAPRPQPKKEVVRVRIALADFFHAV